MEKEKGMIHFFGFGGFQFLGSCLHYKFLIHFLPDGVSLYIQKATAITVNTIKINNPAFILYKLSSHLLPDFVLSQMAIAIPTIAITENNAINASISYSFYYFISNICKNVCYECSN